MQQVQTKNVFKIVLILLIVVLAAVSLFIAYRLSQESGLAPDSSSACTWGCSQSCGCGCSDYFAARPECGGFSAQVNGGNGIPTGSTTSCNGTPDQGFICDQYNAEYQCRAGSWYPTNRFCGTTTRDGEPINPARPNDGRCDPGESNASCSTGSKDEPACASCTASNGSVTGGSDNGSNLGTIGDPCTPGDAATDGCGIGLGCYSCIDGRFRCGYNENGSTVQQESVWATIACTSPGSKGTIPTGGVCVPFTWKCTGGTSGVQCSQLGQWKTDIINTDACGASCATADQKNLQDAFCFTEDECRKNAALRKCQEVKLPDGTLTYALASSGFLGCGNVISGGSGNKCDNCYSVNGAVKCYREGASCGAQPECFNSSTVITTPGNPPNTPSTQTVQCNEICNSSNILCASGLTCYNIGTENRCRLPDNPTSPTCTPETNPTATVASTCPEGSTVPTATISWNMGTYPAQAVRVDISTTSNFATYWSKNVPSGTTVTNGTGFTGSTAFTLQQGTIYYVRVYLTTSGINTNPVSLNTATCTVVAAQCIDLTESGNDPIASGTGNYLEYVLKYQNPATTNPYPNIRLRVGTAGSPVGRDALNTSSSLVSAYSYSFDAITSTHTYTFRWESAAPNGTGVAAGSYDVRVLLDGSTALTSPTECLESITVSQTAQAEPLFNVVKSGAVVCEADGDARIDYTVTAKNIGSVTGVIDFVEDKYDANAVTLGIQPTNINPTYSSVSGGKITWTGDTTARTYTAGQSKTFTYSLTIPRANLLTFTAPGVVNQAKLQYDTSTTQDNSTTFDLRTLLNCTPTAIPNTGIFDDARMLLVGLMFITLGVMVYRTKFGYQLSEKLVGSVFDSVNGKVNNVKVQFRPYEESIIDDLSNKAKGKRSRK